MHPMTSRLTHAKLHHMSKPSVSSGEAAKALGISRMTLLRWLHRDLVSPAWVTPAGQYRWNMDDLERQLDTGNARGPGDVTNSEFVTPQMTASKPQPPAVIAAVITSRLGVLAVQRRDGKPPWSFPAGESEPGESPADTIVREVKEETGLLIRAAEVIHERIHPQTQRHLVYVAGVPATKGAGSRDVHVGDQDELTDVRWLYLGEAIDLMPGMDPVVAQTLTMRMRGLPRRRPADQLPYEAAS
jgi:8-oxo-dGTP pyrophosphatase MutT (NUDIX family)